MGERKQDQRKCRQNMPVFTAETDMFPGSTAGMQTHPGFAPRCMDCWAGRHARSIPGSMTSCRLMRTQSAVPSGPLSVLGVTLTGMQSDLLS